MSTFSSEPAAAVPDGLWSTLSVAGVAIAVLSPDTTVDWCNPGFADLAERTTDEMTGRTIVDALGIERPDRLNQAIAAAVFGEGALERFEVESVDWAGTKRWLALSASVSDTWTEPGRLVLVAENLTAERRGHRRESPMEAARRATEDGLTGLPNRVTFEALLESSLRRAARTLVPLAVMTCDLDGFRVVNERLGDAAGDIVLQAVASRLSHTLRQNDVLARFTADEFIVVAEEVEDEASAHLVARRLASAIAGPIDVDGVDVRIGVSIGFTLARGHERPQELLAEAERAMEGAKRAGKGRSMSFTEVVNGPRQTAASTIDWNELARTAPAEPIAPVIDTTPTEADE